MNRALVAPARRHLALPLLALAALVAAPPGGLARQRTWPAVCAARNLTLPGEDGALRFAVIGDSGTGGADQYRLADRMAEFHAVLPYELVLMLGDNIYGGERPRDYVKKFELPYQPLLGAGVRFHAALGNHDRPEQRLYPPFHMDGRRYYSFRAGTCPSVRFFALDTTLFGDDQLAWLERELSQATEDWKIAFFHHPIYSSGKRHGADIGLRRLLEPLFVRYRVDAVFAGHDHFYERLEPQQDIYYFVSGGAGKLRRGGIGRTGLTRSGYDRGYHFLLFEVASDALLFQAINDRGETIDAGHLPRLRPASPGVLAQSHPPGPAGVLRSVEAGAP